MVSRLQLLPLFLLSVLALHSPTNKRTPHFYQQIEVAQTFSSQMRQQDYVLASTGLFFGIVLFLFTLCNERYLLTIFKHLQDSARLAKSNVSSLEPQEENNDCLVHVKGSLESLALVEDRVFGVKIQGSALLVRQVEEYYGNRWYPCYTRDIPFPPETYPRYLTLGAFTCSGESVSQVMDLGEVQLNPEDLTDVRLRNAQLIKKYGFKLLF